MKHHSLCLQFYDFFKQVSTPESNTLYTHNYQTHKNKTESPGFLSMDASSGQCYIEEQWNSPLRL